MVSQYAIHPILAEETDIKVIAKKIKANLESFTWKHIIGFNYTDFLEIPLPPISEKDSLILSIINIRPFMSFSSSQQLSKNSNKL